MSLGKKWALWALHAVQFLDKPILPTRAYGRGIALLMVITYISMLTALVVSSFYDSQVTYMISSNSRDALKAYYKAKSGLNLSRLILDFQYELEKIPEFARQMRASNFQIYQVTDLLLDPFKTGSIFLQGKENQALVDYDLKEEGASGLGDQSGNYTVSITPEEGRININRFAHGKNPMAIFDLCMLFAPQSYDPIFDASDKNKASRLEVISAIIDWADPDQDRTLLNEQCVVEGSAGDEDALYDRMEQRRSQRYHAKNAPFLTLDELYQVYGITDDFMEAFGNSLTVYPISKVNVNMASGRVLYALLCNAVKIRNQNLPEGQWACSNPRISSSVLLLALGLEGYQQFVNAPLLLLGYYLQGNPQVIEGVTQRGGVVPFPKKRYFFKVVESMKSNLDILQQFIVYSPTALQMMADPAVIETAFIGLSALDFDRGKLNKTISVQGPKIFRIVATGEYNGTQKTLTAIIDFRKPGGKFLYWREN